MSEVKVTRSKMYVRTVQVETQSTGSISKIKKRVTTGLIFLGKVHGSHLKPKYEVFTEWPYEIFPRELIWNNIFRRYKMIDAPCFLSPKHPFST